MRSDVLSKRMFQAGCVGLPWLWIVHVMYWRGSKEESNEGILNPDDHFPEENGAPEASLEEVQTEADKWARRCQNCAMVAMTLWFAWILTTQLLRSHLPSSWFMLNADDEELTGW